VCACMCTQNVCYGPLMDTTSEERRLKIRCEQKLPAKWRTGHVLATEPMARWHGRNDTLLLARGPTRVLVKLDMRVSHECANVWSFSQGLWSRSLSDAQGRPNHI
jgi:hypothetical protein